MPPSGLSMPMSGQALSVQTPTPRIRQTGSVSAPQSEATQVPGIWAGTGWGAGGAVSPDGTWRWTGNRWERVTPRFVPVAAIVGGVWLVAGLMLVGTGAFEWRAAHHVPPGWVGNYPPWTLPVMFVCCSLVVVGLTLLAVALIGFRRARRDGTPASVA
jgi:hypothetical protein